MIEIRHNGETIAISQILIHRTAISVKFFSLIGGEWTQIVKGKNKRLPKFQDVQWPDSGHQFGWSHPYSL